MKIVVDSNRIIASLIKEGTTRTILFDPLFEFLSPDFMITEVRKYEEEIIKKANITKEEFEIFLALIFENITIIPESDYEDLIESLRKEIKDQKDLPYIAVAITTKSYGLWSHDLHFNEQKKIKVLTNIDMLKLSGNLENH